MRVLTPIVFVVASGSFGCAAFDAPRSVAAKGPLPEATAAYARVVFLWPDCERIYEVSDLLSPRGLALSAYDLHMCVRARDHRIRVVAAGTARRIASLRVGEWVAVLEPPGPQAYGAYHDSGTCHPGATFGSFTRSCVAAARVHLEAGKTYVVTFRADWTFDAKTTPAALRGSSRRQSYVTLNFRPLLSDFDEAQVRGRTRTDGRTFGTWHTPLSDLRIASQVYARLAEDGDAAVTIGSAL